MLYFIISYDFIYHIASHYLISWHIIVYYIMSYYTILYYIISYHITWYYIISYCIDSYLKWYYVYTVYIYIHTNNHEYIIHHHATVELVAECIRHLQWIYQTKMSKADASPVACHCCSPTQNSWAAQRHKERNGTDIYISRENANSSTANEIA